MPGGIRAEILVRDVKGDVVTSTTTTTTAHTRRDRWITALVCALIFLASVLVFARVATHDWLTYDDTFHVLENSNIVPPSTAGLARIWTQAYGYLYIPVSYSFWAVCAWLTSTLLPLASTGTSGTDTLSPVLFHAIMPVIHACSSILVLLILRRIGATLAGAALGATIFALHPFQVESVAWLSETRGLLAGVFGLLAIWMWLGWSGARRAHDEALPHAHVSKGGGTRGIVMYLMATLALALALLSKPSAVVVPILVLVLELARGEPVRARWLAPWFVLALAQVLITRSLQTGDHVLAPAPLWARPLIAMDAIAFYLGRLAYPIEMTPDYARTPAEALLSKAAYVTWIVPVLLGALLARDFRRSVTKRWIAMGSLLMLAALSPVLGLVSFDHQNISTVADRYMYLAMLGPALALAMIVPALGRGRAWLWAVAFGASSVLGVLSFQQAGVWKNDLTLWTHALTVRPYGPTTLTNLGHALAERNENERAIALFERALAARPGSPNASVNLAWSTMKLGRFAQAEELFKNAISVAPESARAHIGRGLVMAQTGRLSEAETSFREARRLNPRDAEAHANLGLVLLQRAQTSEAIVALEEATRLRPRFAIAQLNLGLALRSAGNPSSAAVALKRAGELDATLAPAWCKVAEASLVARRLDEAADHFEMALLIDPRSADAADGLGRARLQQERVDDAIAAFERALAIFPAHSTARTNLAAALARRAESGKDSQGDPGR